MRRQRRTSRRRRGGRGGGTHARVKIPISSVTHKRLCNVCEGYGLREPSALTRGSKLRRCLDDGVIAYAPLMRRLVALRTMRKNHRNAAYFRLDADVRALRAYARRDGCAHLDRYRNPCFRMDAVLVEPRLVGAKQPVALARAHSRAILAWYQDRLREDPDGVKRRHVRATAAPHGRIAIAFPVAVDAGDDAVAAERARLAHITDARPLEVDGRSYTVVGTPRQSSLAWRKKMRPI